MAGEVPPDPTSVATLELEAQLARRPDVYLVVRPPDRVLEIRARGIVLDSVPLVGVEVVSPRPLLRAETTHTLPVPTVLTVTDGPGESAREVIAPPELREMPAEDEEETAEAAPAAPAATPTPVPEAPASFRASLNNGWDLWICETLPPTGMVARLRAAVRDGWDRLWGRGDNPPPALTLAMARADAQRLFHLLGDERAILVSAGAR